MDKVSSKQSVALAIRDRRDPSRVLLVRRPDEDEEFPGMWGLPAASCRQGEALDAAATRIGWQKLGTGVELGHVLGSGAQKRPAYTIEMTLYEARLEGGEPRLPAFPDGEGVTIYTAWRWGDPAEVRKSATRGSLCSQLLLDALDIKW